MSVGVSVVGGAVVVGDGVGDDALDGVGGWSVAVAPGALPGGCAANFY